MQPEKSLSRPSSDGRDTLTPSSSARQKTSSWKLLKQAVFVLGAERLADSLGVTAAEVERLIEADRPMTYAQQRVLAMAVLVCGDGHRDLHRRAAALLAQAHAAEDFASGITERHMYPPTSHRWK